MTGIGYHVDLMVIGHWLWAVTGREESGLDTWAGRRVRVRKPSSGLRVEGPRGVSLRCCAQEAAGCLDRERAGLKMGGDVGASELCPGSALPL